MYRFKFYFDDYTTKLSSIKVSNPLELCNDFDGIIPWSEYEEISARVSKKDKSITTRYILEQALRGYYDFIKPFKKIEIVNDESGEILESITLTKELEKKLKKQKEIDKIIMNKEQFNI